MMLDADIRLSRNEFALDIQFRAPPGITALFGPSGGGKTTILSMDAVTGPYDFIAVIEGPSLDSIGQLVTESIGIVDGVTRTTTCVAISLG